MYYFASDILGISPIEDEDKVKLDSENYSKLASGVTPLHLSAISGDVINMNNLLDDGCDVNIEDSIGRTPLMFAIKGKKEFAINCLLKAGANIFQLNHNNKSALHMFFAEPNLTIISHKIFLNKFREQCSTDEEIIERVINASANLYQATFLGRANIIQFMINQGFNPNAVHPVCKQTCLHAAVMGEDVESVKVLLKYGVDHNALDIMGFNALGYLYQFCTKHTDEKIKLLQILLDAGVSATSCHAEKGTFQIGSTLGMGNSEAIRTVLQSRINFRAKDSTNMNFLHYFAQNSEPNVIQELKLQVNKFDMNEVDSNGRNPLFMALMHVNVRMLKFLLDQGAKANCVDLNGLTPLYCSCMRYYNSVTENDNIQCLELLLQHNADPNHIIMRNGRRTTAFHKAMKMLSLDRKRLIVAHIAIIKDTKTPVIKSVLNKIKLNQNHYNYFRRYRSILKKKISGSTTVLKLITSGERKMALHLRNKSLLSKLKRLEFKPKKKFLFYYHSIIEQNVRKGLRHKHMQDIAAVMLGKLLEDYPIVEIDIISKIISYLNNEDLEQVCQLQYLL